MHKRIHTKAVFFKAMLVAVFGIFFFVQAQSEFIYCAYNNDFPAAIHNSTSPAGSSNNSIHADKSTRDALDHLKLNKRYQVVSVQAILPAGPAIPVYEAAPAANWCMPRVYVFTLFIFTKSLRGPPFI